jgi:hypothetical protein
VKVEVTYDSDQITNRGNCPLCWRMVPGRHPDRGGTHAGPNIIRWATNQLGPHCHRTGAWAVGQRYNGLVCHEPRRYD